ncbi:MAG: rane protein [Thermoleophilaceae bacterium]|jgi:membrane protein|nr:rane protein [Thermoleophilaceae bacterium]
MRERWHELLRAFEDHDLLTYASAISFRVLFAVLPLALLGLGLLGAFGLTDVWSTDVAPQVKAQTSGPAFQVIDDTVRRVLEDKQAFWATAGALIAIWEVSGAMRAIMTVLSRIYGDDESRDFWPRALRSIWLATLVTAMLLGAVATIAVVPRVLDGFFGTVLGWVAGAALLFATVGAIVRLAPVRDRPLRWVSFGSVLVIIGWIAGSLLFRWYVTSVADYGSIFGSLAVVMIVFGYLYLMAIVFLTGLQLDAMIRHEAEGSDDDEPGDHPEIIVATSLASVEH